MRERDGLQSLRRVVSAGLERDHNARREWRATSLIDGALQVLLNRQQAEQELWRLMDANVGRPIYSEEEAAQFLGTSVRRLRELTAQNTGPRATRLYRWVKYRGEALEDWVRGQMAKRAPNRLRHVVPSESAQRVVKRHTVDAECRQLLIEAVGQGIYTEDGAAQFLGVPVEYLRLLRSNNRGPCFARDHASVIYRRDALESWVRACEADPSAGDPFAPISGTTLRRPR